MVENTETTETEQTEPRWINIEPTPEGYRHIKKVMQHSIGVYQGQLKRIEELVEDSEIDRFEMQETDRDLITSALGKLRTSIEESVSNLQETVDDLTRCGY